MKSIFRILVFLNLFLFLGCLASEDSKDLLSGLAPNTCVSAEIFSFDGVLVKFNIPDVAIDFRVSRDGVPIYAMKDKAETEVIDKGLVPGKTYRYRCEIVVDINVGHQKIGDDLVVDLPVNEAPTFSGLSSATLDGTDKALLEWSLTEGAIIDHYKVFKYIGIATDKSDFPSEPVATLSDIFSVSNLVTNLGDEITYSFRVTACNSYNICDDNNEIRTVTTPDTGVPTTVGATGIILNNGTVTLNTPWTDQNGHVSTRSVYRASTATGTACPAIFGLYGKVNDVIVVDPKDTPQQVDAAGVLNEGLKYCFVVRDTDPSGNFENNFNIQSVEIGDITNPSFLSPVNLVRDGGDVEGALVASWTAMAREIDEPLLGAHEYLVYISSVAHPGAPDSDPCATGTLNQTVSAAGYSQGDPVSVNITGLNSRYWHRVCVKAIDSSSNESTQRPNALASTGDVTAPNFAGVQSANFNNATASIDFSFIVPVATDIRNYRITTVRTRGGVVNTPVVLMKNLGSLTANTTVMSSFTLAEADLGDNDIVSIKVDVCDNANPDFNNQDNCSATSAEQVLTLPDATPPPGFTGVATASRGVGHRTVEVTWGTPSTGNWNDYAGFKVYYVNGSGDLVGLNSSACLCAGGDCVASPKMSCEVSQEDGGALLVPSKTYEMYVAAFDLAGNQTVSYIAHNGGSKITAFSKAQDTVDPSFNASMNLTYDAGARIVFDAASDEQDSAIDLDYEIYRKESSTFICPMTPYSSTGGCDNISPLATVTEGSFGVETNRLVYVDATVTDGVTYYYQFCAVDDAGNRKCQDGAVGELVITDITAPTVANVDSTKVVGGGTSWTVSFDVADNIVSVDNLIINIYKSLAAYPTEANPGVPVYTKSGGTVTLSGNTASFNDTGLADVESAYYLILVQDLSGNKTYVQARDMGPAPIITSVVWDDPLYPDGEPKANREAQSGDSDFRITIHGVNLENIELINDVTSPAGEGDKRHCDTSRILSNTGTEISCRTSSKIYYTSNYTLYVKDKYGRDIVFNSGAPATYCEYATANGITELRGLGTVSRRYVLCTPDHIKQIGRDADNPNNTQDYIGFFYLGGDIDFTGVTDFKGIPSVHAGEFSLLGASNRKIMNLTIDNSATNEEAAFILGCTGSTLDTYAMIEDVDFENFIVKTGSARGAVVITDKSCEYANNRHVFGSITIRDSELHSNNTAGFLAAEFLTVGDEAHAIYVYDSTIYSTRVDATTAVGSIIGKLSGSTNNVEAEFSALRTRDADLKPALGQTDAGYNIGGIIGKITASNILLSTPQFYHNESSSYGEIFGGLDYVGGIVGYIEGPLSNISLTSPRTVRANIDNTGSTGSYRGGLIGLVNRGQHGNVSNLTIQGALVNDVNIEGDGYLGGVVGQIISTSNISILDSVVENTDVIGSSNFVGGFVGRLRDSTNFASSNSFVYNVSDMFGLNKVGGLIGEIYRGSGHSFIESHFRGGTVNAVSGTGVGGLIGHIDKSNDFIMDQCATGNVVISGSSNVGGLIGSQTKSSNFMLTRSYVAPIGDSVVISGNNNIGGLIGRLDYGNFGTASFEVSKSAAFAKVSSTGAGGGFLGSYSPANDTSLSIVEDNFYKSDYTGLNVKTDNPAHSVAGEIEGKNTAELAIEATYVNWDFTNDWHLSGGRAKLNIYSSYTWL